MRSTRIETKVVNKDSISSLILIFSSIKVINWGHEAKLNELPDHLRRFIYKSPWSCRSNADVGLERWKHCSGTQSNHQINMIGAVAAFREICLSRNR